MIKFLTIQKKKVTNYWTNFSFKYFFYFLLLSSSNVQWYSTRFLHKTILIAIYLLLTLSIPNDALNPHGLLVIVAFKLTFLAHISNTNSIFFSYSTKCMQLERVCWLSYRIAFWLSFRLEIDEIYLRESLSVSSSLTNTLFLCSHQ